MEVIPSKVLALFLMQILTLLLGLLPLKLVNVLTSLSSTTSSSSSSRSKAEFCISLLNCFAGGVFLGTTFLHLLPEVREQTDQVIKESNVNTDFPVDMFVVSLGFFLIMIIEHVVMALQHHNVTSTSSYKVENNVKDRDNKTEERTACVDASNPEASPKKTSYGTVPVQQQQHNHDDRQISVVPPGERHDCQESLLVNIEARDDNCVHIIHPTHHQKHHKDTSQIQGVRSFILLLSLSVHTIFEGLALGLQKTTPDVWILFGAVVIHKMIIAFTMGIQFSSTMRNKCMAASFMVFFSLMSPLGVAIGTGVTAISTNDFAVDLANACLQGVATGTFVYVTFFEVLQKEVGQDHSLFKVLMVVLGYALIAVINLFAPKD